MNGEDEDDVQESSAVAVDERLFAGQRERSFGFEISYSVCDYSKKKQNVDLGLLT